MTRKSICVLALAGLLLAAPHQALAHSGGTDRDGCHMNHQTGGRHCHNRKDEDDVNWAIVGGVAGGVLLLWLLAKGLDCDDDASPARLHVLPQLRDGNRPGIAAEYAVGGPHRLGVHATTPSGDERGPAYLGAYWRLRF